MKRLYKHARRLPENRLVRWGFLGVSVLFTAFFFFFDEHDSHREFSISNAGSYMEGFRIVSKKDGKDAWIISARRADFSKDQTTAKMEAVAMDIQKEGVVLTADKGTYNMNTKDLALQDNVTIRGRNSVIRTANLSWNPSLGLLSAEGKVEMKGEKFVLEGEGLTATPENKITLRQNVKATFY